MHRTTLRLLASTMALAPLTACNSSRHPSLVRAPFDAVSSAVMAPAAWALKPRFYHLGQRFKSEAKTENAKGNPAVKFTGSLRLHHICGGLFFFEQSESDPFTCTVKRDDGYWVIKPESFITGGSSIPRGFWGMRGLAPMDFAKSAIIHDWLFEAHHRWCLAHADYIAAKATQATSSKTADCGASCAAKIMHTYRDYADPARLDIDPALKQQMRAMHIEYAADIIARCVAWEGNQSDAFDQGLNDLIKNNPPEMQRGIDKRIYGDIDPARSSASTIGQYHWATRSFLAKRFWDGGRDSTRTSNTRLVQLLLNPSNGTSGMSPIDEAVAQGRLAPSLANMVKKTVAEAGDATHRHSGPTIRLAVSPTVARTSADIKVREEGFVEARTVSSRIKRSVVRYSQSSEEDSAAAKALQEKMTKLLDIRIELEPVSAPKGSIELRLGDDIHSSR